jgi:prepilin-type N-terminal cleavage/methylation domain-containing protein
MMSYRPGNTDGFTLMEIMMATAIFAVVIGVTAISLSSFYVQMDIQEQRIEAMQSCRAVLGDMREKREEFALSSDGYDWEAFLQWINAQQDLGWPGHIRDNEAYVELKDHTLTVQVLDMEGAAAEPGDNPLQVFVTANWTDRQGRTLETRLATVLTNQ